MEVLIRSLCDSDAATRSNWLPSGAGFKGVLESRTAIPSYVSNMDGLSSAVASVS